VEGSSRRVIRTSRIWTRGATSPRTSPRRSWAGRRGEGEKREAGHAKEGRGEVERILPSVGTTVLGVELGRVNSAHAAGREPRRGPHEYSSQAADAS